MLRPDLSLFGATVLLLLTAACDSSDEFFHTHDGNLNASELERATYGAAHGDAGSMKVLKLHYCIKAGATEECNRWSTAYGAIEARYLADIARLMQMGDENMSSARHADALTMYDGALALALQVRDGNTTEVYELSLRIGKCCVLLGDLSEAQRYASWASEVEAAIRPTNPAVD